MKYYAIIGRIPFDDEDSCYTMKAESDDQATDAFEERIARDNGFEDAEDCRRMSDDGSIYVNHILSSDTPIQGGIEIKPCEKCEKPNVIGDWANYCPSCREDFLRRLKEADDFRSKCEENSRNA